jgi:hypothetical protein
MMKAVVLTRFGSDRKEMQFHRTGLLPFCGVLHGVRFVGEDWGQKGATSGTKGSIAHISQTAAEGWLN